MNTTRSSHRFMLDRHYPFNVYLVFAVFALSLLPNWKSIAALRSRACSLT